MLIFIFCWNIALRREQDGVGIALFVKQYEVEIALRREQNGVGIDLCIKQYEVEIALRREQNGVGIASWGEHFFLGGEKEVGVGSR